MVESTIVPGGTFLPLPLYNGGKNMMNETEYIMKLVKFQILHLLDLPEKDEYDGVFALQ